MRYPFYTSPGVRAMRSSVVTDPGIIAFIEQVSAGTNAAADSTAGLLLRLLNRVARLERAVEALKQPKPPARARTHDSAPTHVIKTGVDFLDGGPNPVRIEQRVARPRGRPSGSRDQVPRVRRWPRKPEGEEDVEDLGGLAASDALLDPARDRHE